MSDVFEMHSVVSSGSKIRLLMSCQPIFMIASNWTLVLNHLPQTSVKKGWNLLNRLDDLLKYFISKCVYNFVIVHRLINTDDQSISTISLTCKYLFFMYLKKRREMWLFPCLNFFNNVLCSYVILIHLSNSQV